MKKTILKGLSLMTVFTMLLTGCANTQTKVPEEQPSNPQTNNTATPEPTEKQADSNSNIDTSKPVELRFAWWGSDNRHEAIKKVIDLYTKEHPNVTIKPEYGAWDGWQQNILTQMGGKNEADIIQVNYNWVHSFGKGKNVFQNLEDLSQYIDLSNWDDTYLNAMRVNGELAAIPHGMTARAYLYSKPLFEAANIAYPTTYEELIAAGGIIGKNNTPTGADNNYTLMNIGKECPDLFIAQMLYNETGKVMQVDGKVQYTTEEVAKVFKQYQAFAEAGAMETFQQQDAIDNESNPVWTSGRGGSIYEWISTMDKYLGSYKGGNMREEIAVAPYIAPSKDINPKIYVKPNLGYAVSKNSKNPEVAADFLNFFFTNEEAVKALGTSIGISSNKVTRGIQEAEGHVSGIMKEGFDMLNNYEQTVMDPYFEDSNVRGERYTAIEAFRSGKSSAEEAAAEYINRQQAALDKLFK